MDSWPPIVTRRFDGESEIEYRRRAQRISEIITGFRRGRVDARDADRLEDELMLLQSPDIYARELSLVH